MSTELTAAEQAEIFHSACLECCKPVLTTKEVYSQFGIRKQTLEAWRKDGLKYSKPGAVYFYRREDIMAYLERYAYAK